MNKKTGKTLCYDYDSCTIRGSFINQVLIGIIMIIIIVAVFDDGVCGRAVKLTELIVIILGLSFGIWKTGSLIGKHLESKGKGCDEDNQQ